MEVTILTWTVAATGLLLIGLLSGLQLVAVVRPRDRWTIDNVYGGNPDATDRNAYFAFNQGHAWMGFTNPATGAATLTRPPTVHARRIVGVPAP
jgi:hypothetical protein